MNTWNLRQTVGAVAVAVAVAGVGGAAIAAAANGGHDMFDGGPGGPPPGAFSARHADPEPDALHGERVTSDGRDGFVTRLEQTGRVTAISADSVTVRSDDAFVRTYAIRDSTRTFAVGDDVTISATREGEAAVINTMRPPLSSGRVG